MDRIIPEEASLVKEGLYVHEHSFTIGEQSFTAWDLYSAEGWCFYDLQQAENYVDGVIGGELIPEDKRAYSRFAIMPKDEAYVMNNIISIPIPEVSESDEKETATPMSRRRT